MTKQPNLIHDYAPGLFVKMTNFYYGKGYVQQPEIYVIVKLTRHLRCHGGVKYQQCYSYTLLELKDGAGCKLHEMVEEKLLDVVDYDTAKGLKLVEDYEDMMEEEPERIIGNLLAMDWEFNNSQEKFINPVSVAYQFPKKKAQSTWVKDDPEVKAKLYKALKERFLVQHDVLLTFSAPAELRPLRALGFTKEELRQINVIDLYVEWRQCKFNNENWMYGLQFQNGRKVISVPPSFNKKKNKYVNNTEVGNYLAACVARLLGIDMDTAHKKVMRDIIIENKDHYTDEEIRAILDYGKSDTVHLYPVWDEFKRFMREDVGFPQYEEAALNRGRFMIEVALQEENGIPIDIEAAGNLCMNNAQAKEELITDLVKNYGDFYVRKPSEIGAIKGEWKKNYAFVEKFIIDNDMGHIWPKTEKSGKFKTDAETFEKYGEGYEALSKYRRVMKNISHINYFRPNGYETILKNIGDDFNLRAFLAPFGSQTGRSQPKPSQGYIPAMSNWLRCLIRPPKGYVIIAKDYSAQEFGVAAVLSGDQNMLESYRTGYPYITFAKLAGSIPQDADPKRIKNPGDDPMFLKYYMSRVLFKSIVLGQQFGMGPDLLAVKITADTGTYCSPERAKEYIDLHKEAYPEYWEYMYAIVEEYEYSGKLILHDGWVLLGDNHNSLSVRNFPIQGTAACIMREACVLAGGYGCDLIFTLHDALYAIAKEEEAEKYERLLDKAMQKAVRNVIGDTLTLRIDTDIHTHDHTWVEEKGQKDYELLKTWLEPHENWSEIEKNYIKKMGLVMTGYTSPIS